MLRAGEHPPSEHSHPGLRGYFSLFLSKPLNTTPTASQLALSDSFSFMPCPWRHRSQGTFPLARCTLDTGKTFFPGNILFPPYLVTVYEWIYTLTHCTLSIVAHFFQMSSCYTCFPKATGKAEAMGPYFPHQTERLSKKKTGAGTTQAHQKNPTFSSAWQGCLLFKSFPGRSSAALFSTLCATNLPSFLPLFLSSFKCPNTQALEVY